jgi:hypothetical protein
MLRDLALESTDLGSYRSASVDTEITVVRCGLSLVATGKANTRPKLFIWYLDLTLSVEY